jgi:hypothetical protein
MILRSVFGEGGDGGLGLGKELRHLINGHTSHHRE